MIFYISDGRLGNQLFQYFFIRSIYNKKQIIISVNFDDILGLFDHVDNVLNIQNKYLRFFVKKFAPPILNILVRMKIISSCRIKEYEENGFTAKDNVYSKTYGLLPITYVYPCFAQSESFFKKSKTEHLTLKKIHLENAIEFIGKIPSEYKKVFVHIRRGDYINFSVLGKIGATLPLSYYRNGIKWFEDNIDNPFFIFLTDDPEFVEYCFENIPNKVISRNIQFVDFAIITLCEYGIVSNSSFSWWAAYMMLKREKVFSPKFWLGWKSEVEYPKGIKPSFADHLEVIVNER